MTSNSENQDDEPQIVVDDDWKAKVAAEKEETVRAAKVDQPDKNFEQARDLPKPTFEILISTFSTQAMMALGFFPDPATGKSAANRPLAKHLIDMLAVIQDISKGNLSEDQAETLENVLHKLRLAFLNAPIASAKQESEPPKKSTLELP